MKEVGDSAKCLSGSVCDVESLLSAVQSMASAGLISEEGVSLQQNILQVSTLFLQLRWSKTIHTIITIYVG